MYAELTTVKVKPEFLPESPKFIEQFSKLHKSLKGYKNQTFIGDKESGESLCLSIWETKEDLDAAVAACLPGLQQAKGMLKEEPTLKVYEVLYKD